MQLRAESSPHWGPCRPLKAFDKPYDETSNPVLADHSALIARLPEVDMDIMVASAAAADHPQKGWLNENATLCANAIGPNNILAFSNTIDNNWQHE